MKNIIILLLLAVASCSDPTIHSPTKIAFGSCNRQDLPQPHWQTIIENDPDLWVWLGDIVYGDTYDMDSLWNTYLELLNNPGYKKLLATCPVVGIWDDHDYGLNDGGKEFEMKDESKKLLMEFLQVPKEANLYNHDGVYTSYTYGEPPRQMKMILLDTRYFRDPVIKVENGYEPNQNGDVLGEDQWKWFEKEMRNSTANFTVIGSSIQIIPQEHRFEKWANLPKSRQRFLSLMEETASGDILIISGDRHIAEVSKVSLQNGHDLIEVTSSGLTHCTKATNPEPNEFRVSDLIRRKNFGVITLLWDNPQPIALVEIKGINNEVLSSVNIRL